MQTDLGERLLGAFNSPSGIPYSDVNLSTMKGYTPQWSPDSSVSEVTSVQLEFRDLDWITGKTGKFQVGAFEFTGCSFIPCVVGNTFLLVQVSMFEVCEGVCVSEGHY